MSNKKGDQLVILSYNNWYQWEHYIKSSTRRKNAKFTINRPEPIDPRTPQVIPATATAPAVTVTPQPTAEEMKAYCEGLEKWEVANNIAAGVILGSLSAEVMHLVDPDEPAKDMYDQLKATIIQHTSGSSMYGTQIELVQKQFTDTPMLDNFEKHLTFFRSKNADLIATSSGLDDSFLVFLLLYSFNSNMNPIWSITSTNIATSGVPTRQWSFEQVARKLHEALRNSIHSSDSLTSSGPSPNQMALNTTVTKTAQSHYSGPACKYPKCCCSKSHATEDCWTKEKDEHERDKEKKAKEKKYKAKRAERKVTLDSSSSESESASDSGSESEPCHKS